jgi:hypothetical protein
MILVLISVCPVFSTVVISYQKLLRKSVLHIEDGVGRSFCKSKRILKYYTRELELCLNALIGVAFCKAGDF